ncbi:Smr/MutS family protein [Azospirillum sp. SYSU D00513]|uniref:Smr/MutS family protein n=1 Tax=Azospirillum sp. SYSU D00513 TaxID=2812561 RepID=UPI001A963D01|nr:Smr/MutS family protein [Azospirillum sp. SYSU D00513]
MRRRRSVSEGEKRLWRLAMRDAEPLPGRAFEPEPSELPPPAEPEPEPVKTSLAPAPTGRPAPRPSLPPLTPGSTANIDRRTAERFRRGDLVLDGRIDLHGMTQAQAHTALASFVLRSWNEGRRCILVITGKGSYSAQGGVLRQAVPRWLAEAPLRPMVLAVQTAQLRDGGDGALYVLIKRRRDRK